MAARKRTSQDSSGGSYQPIGPDGKMVWVPSGTLNPTIVIPGTTTTTSPPQTYRPPTRTPAAPSGTPTTSTTTPATTTTTPPATLPPKTGSPPTTNVPKKGGSSSPTKKGPSFREIEERDKDYQPPKEDKPGKKDKKGKKDGKNKTEETADTAAVPTLEENVRRLYPQFAYLLDNPELFGDDVLSVIKRAVKDGWTTSRFQGSIQATKYWQTTVAEAKNFDALTPADQDMKVQDAIDEIGKVMDTTGFDDTKLYTFARDLARRGVKGEQLKKLTYGMALSEGMTPEVQADVMSSESAMSIKRIVKAYGGAITDETLKQYLTDGKTPEQVQTMYREKAKGLYPHLSAQFDADLTMDDITKDYKAIASNVLERSEAEIDFTKPEFLESIAADDGKGNKRQLSLGEWTKKLKTDDRYGYSKTTRAIQDARQIAFNISKAFGKVL